MIRDANRELAQLSAGTGPVIRSEAENIREVHMQSEIELGQRFTFDLSSDDASPERQAVVTRVLSNREGGFGPEVDSFFRIGWRLTNYQKQRFRQRWCSSVELTERIPRRTYGQHYYAEVISAPEHRLSARAPAETRRFASRS